MNWDDYAKWGKHIADWGADYHKTLPTMKHQIKTELIRGYLAQSLQQSRGTMDRAPLF